MEAGYVKADSRNLPDIDHLMIAQFFQDPTCTCLLRFVQSRTRGKSKLVGTYLSLYLCFSLTRTSLIVTY